MPWAGQVVTVEGMLDPVNIFDKQHYPQLPYEKFVLKDGRGHAVEVWAVAADNSPIFRKLARRGSDQIAVTGRLEAVKLPVMGQCTLNVKVVIDDADQIAF